jgi:Trp operon repressor
MIQDAETKLRKYMQGKYQNNNITTLLNMVQTVMKENEELKERVNVLEQILHMHLPIIEE